MMYYRRLRKYYPQIPKINLRSILDQCPPQIPYLSPPLFPKRIWLAQIAITALPITQLITFCLLLSSRYILSSKADFKLIQIV